MLIHEGQASSGGTLPYSQGELEGGTLCGSGMPPGFIWRASWIPALRVGILKYSAALCPLQALQARIWVHRRGSGRE